jgi:mRNA-degrading endonuclease RelE of RelBE toxin-antitoxin system
MVAKKQTKYKIRAPAEIVNFIRGTHPLLKRKIKSALKRIIDDPFTGNSLRDELKGLKSFRVSQFRIIYRISSKHIIEIIAIGPRKTIYEETYRMIKG